MIFYFLAVKDAELIQIIRLSGGIKSHLRQNKDTQFHPEIEKENVLSHFNCGQNQITKSYMAEAGLQDKQRKKIQKSKSWPFGLNCSGSRPVDVIDRCISKNGDLSCRSLLVLVLAARDVHPREVQFRVEFRRRFLAVGEPQLVGVRRALGDSVGKILAILERFDGLDLGRLNPPLRSS